MYTVNKR